MVADVMSQPPEYQSHGCISSVMYAADLQNNNIYVSNCSSKINQLICVSTIQVFSQVMTGYDPLIHVDSTYLIIDMSNICCLPFLAM